MSTRAFVPLRPNGRSWLEVCIFTIESSPFLLQRIHEAPSCLLPLPAAARRLQKLSSAQIPPSAKVTQPRFTSQDISARFLSRDSSARIPQPRFLSQESSAKIPQQRLLSKDCSAKILQPRFLSQDSSARIPQPGFLSQDSSREEHQNCLGSRAGVIFLKPWILQRQAPRPKP